MIRFNSKTISTKNSKRSSLPYYGIYGIYTRGNVLIGTLQEGRSLTFRREHQGHNTWSVTTVSLFDSEHEAIFSKEEALLWNETVSTPCCIGKRNGVETPLIILDKMMQQEDFFLRPLIVAIGDSTVTSQDWWETCERLEWWQGNLPDFDWANAFNAKDIYHFLPNEIIVPKGVPECKYYRQEDIPEGFEIARKENLNGEVLIIKKKALEFEIQGQRDIDEEGEQRPRRRAKAARKSTPEEEAPIAE